VSPACHSRAAGVLLTCGSASSRRVETSAGRESTGKAEPTTTVVVTLYVTERRTSTITLPRSLSSSGALTSSVGV
jgi:hypothetical protein